MFLPRCDTRNGPTASPFFCNTIVILASSQVASPGPAYNVSASLLKKRMNRTTHATMGNGRRFREERAVGPGPGLASSLIR